MALCRPILGSERHRYAFAWPDKLGTSPMAHHGSNGNRSGKREGKVESRKSAPDSAWVWRMSRLTRDGTAEPNSRDQTLRRERGQGKSYIPCSAHHEQDWQPYPVDAQSAESDDHTRRIISEDVVTVATTDPS